MQTKLLLINPPFTQLNTAYPATSYLKGFLEEHEVSVSHCDLSIELFTKIFKGDFLRLIFQEISLYLAFFYAIVDAQRPACSLPCPVRR